jgi:D-tagatose-1,6-bisphosphate aldolase subunit GatZ/KbaZ
LTHVLQQLGSSANNREMIGIHSICSAHPLVLEASVRQAVEDSTPLLIEATSNQVNQFGGYTGMVPASFREFVHEIAAKHGLAEKKIILGGDHLGPNPWQSLPAAEAMERAVEMVKAYSQAGFEKIHLDASIPCAGENSPLPDSAVAERAAVLCRAAEESSNGQPRFYVIGTEVPVPGGATESLQELAVTTYEHASHTLETHRRIFSSAGLDSVWPRIIALVVQPGVEFNHDSVVDYVCSKTAALRKLLAEAGGLVFEAHSTDYQKPDAYKKLVQDGFSILKVGPALTFALREALFSLARIEEEIIPAGKRSRLPEIVDTIMVKKPEYWAKYYKGTAENQRLQRQYSYSDRIRYYWQEPEVQAAVNTVLSNLEETKIPDTLISFTMPEQYSAVRAGLLRPEPRELIIDKIRGAIRPYAVACRRIRK